MKSLSLLPHSHQFKKKKKTIFFIWPNQPFFGFEKADLSCLLPVYYYYVSPRRGIRFVFAPVSDRSLSLSQSVISYLLFGITRPLLERE